MDDTQPPAEADSGPVAMTYKLRRQAEGFAVRWAGWWQRRRFRWLVYAGGAGLFLIFLLWLLIARNLPDAESLLEYESPLPTVVRDINGEPFHSYARERRVQLEYADFPQLLV